MEPLVFDFACHVNHDISKCVCDDPIIPVILHYGGKKFKTDGLIDSGCSTTHASTVVAELLGIDLRTCVETESIGIGGKSNMITAYMTQVEFEIEGGGAPFLGTILFVKDLPYSVLLGQDSFFCHFDVIFQKTQNKFSIQRVT